MPVNFRALLAIILAIGLGQNSIAEGPSVAFVDVTVIAMDSEVLSPHQTVVTRGGSIVGAGPVSTVKVPMGSEIISGRGRYLIPGLVDMHTHFLRPPNPGNKQDLDFERYLQFNELFATLHIATA